MTSNPNFLFVQADQLAARALRAYGNEVSRTPNIDRLGDEGVVFEHACCNYPLCAPSRFSTLSGLLPSNAGAYGNGARLPLVRALRGRPSRPFGSAGEIKRPMQRFESARRVSKFASLI